MPGALETNPEEASASVRENVADVAAAIAQSDLAGRDGGSQGVAAAPRSDLGGAAITSDRDGDGAAVKTRTNHNKITETLLRQAHEKGWTLAQCADRKYMNRAISTLQRRAREFDLHFPDYEYTKRASHQKKRRDG